MTPVAAEVTRRILPSNPIPPSSSRTYGGAHLPVPPMGDHRAGAPLSQPQRLDISGASKLDGCNTAIPRAAAETAALRGGNDQIRPRWPPWNGLCWTLQQTLT